MNAMVLENKKQIKEEQNDKKEINDTSENILQEAKRIIEERRKRNLRAINRPHDNK